MDTDRKLRIAAINKESIVDGKGLRYVVYEQGCNHNCIGCHNPETHDFKGGKLFAIKTILKDIEKDPCLDGVTLSGGDPFFQAKNNVPFLKEVKKKNINVWAYTGFKIEDFLAFINGEPTDKRINADMIEMLKLVDVLVDGRFELENRSLTCKFRGSTNQRIIDVKKTLETNNVTEEI